MACRSGDASDTSSECYTISDSEVAGLEDDVGQSMQVIPFCSHHAIAKLHCLNSLSSRQSCLPGGPVCTDAPP